MNKKSLRNINFSPSIYHSMNTQNSPNIIPTVAPAKVTVNMKKQQKAKMDSLKDTLGTLADNLKKSKKINDSLYNRLKIMTFSKVKESTLLENIKLLQDIPTTTTKKIKVKDFKVVKSNIKQEKNKTEKLNKIKDKLIKLNAVRTIQKQFKNYKQSQHQVTQVDKETFEFNFQPQPNDILNAANTYYTNIKFKIPKNLDFKILKKEYFYTFNDEPSRLNNILDDVFNKQKHTYKCNISIGFTLIKETQEKLDFKKSNYTVQFKVYYASNNSRLLSHPVVIDSVKDNQKLKDEINKLNLVEKLTDLRPSSSWKFYEFLYVRVETFDMMTPIGKAHDLPIHFKTGSNEKALLKFEGYNDFLCFWRCLAIFFNPSSGTNRLITKVKHLFNKFYENKNNINLYQGIKYLAYNEALNCDEYEYENKHDEIDEVEKFFEININVYTQEEEGITNIDRRSMSKYSKTLNLMRHDNHFMYIKNMDLMRHCYKCKSCSKCFTNLKACTRHEIKCICKKEFTKHTFVGGNYNKQQTLFERILKIFQSEKNEKLKNQQKEQNKKDKIKDDRKTYYSKHKHFPMSYMLKVFGLTKEDLFYPNEIVYDFESLKKIIDKTDDDDKGKQLTFSADHVPVSVSILSNVEGYDNKPIFLCDESPEILIDKFVKSLTEISNKSLELLSKKYSKVTLFLDSLIKESMPGDYEDGEPLEDETKTLINLKNKFISWYSVIPVVSFNGSKYDINLMKQYLHNSLNTYGETVDFAIKKMNSYMSLKTQHLQFLDIRSYLAPDYTYDKFVKAYKCNLTKGYFPYDWLTDFKKLEQAKLPPIEEFYNSLKCTPLAEEEYNVCINAWNDNKMTTMKDFLEWYNNLDVIPFVEAIEKMKQFYKTKKLDIFKDGVSLPGISLKYLMSSTNENFSLFKEEDNEYFYIMKNSIVGGPSIIFHRYHEAGKTLIRNKKLCATIQGLDANALYLSCLGGLMPTGDYKIINSYESVEKLTDDILNDKFFGFVEVDIETPDELKPFFSDFPIIFLNATPKEEDIGDYMRQRHKDLNLKFSESPKLISTFSGTKLLIYSPFLKFMLNPNKGVHKNQALKITKFYSAIQYTPKQPFQKFVEEVTDARRAGDVDDSLKLIADTMKLMGNAPYGKTITDKLNFVSTTYANNKNITKKINDPHFKDLEELYNESYEVTSSKREIKLDLPNQIGLAVYNLAKLKMCEFYYNCIDKYIDRSDFQLMHMDTDSFYFALSAKTLDEIIKPEMREEWEKDKYNWFPSTSKEPHPTFKIDGKPISMEKYTSRTPGLFKDECTKDKEIALCSKMYCCASFEDDGKDKFTSKGIQKSNDIKYKDFENVLNKQEHTVTNNGFRTVDNKIKTYKQIKKGLSDIYFKRRVLGDGSSTEPLDIKNNIFIPKKIL